MQHEEMLETPIEQLDNTDHLDKPTTEFKAPSNEPEDKGNLVYWIFMLYGFAVLLPWNSFLNSLDYFQLEMPQKYAPASTYPFANTCLLVASQVFFVLVGDRYTYTQRIVTSTIGLSAIVLALPYLAQLREGLNYWVIFGVLIPYGGLSGMFQGTVFTMAAYLPFKYMGAVSIGSGVCGFACNILRAITLAVFPSTPGAENERQMAYYSAILFFSITGFTLISCIVLHLCYVRKNPFYIYYLDWSAASPTESVTEVSGGQIIDSESPDDYNLLTQNEPSLNQSMAQRPKKESFRNFIKVVARNFTSTQGLLYCLFYVFIVTFVVFPGVAFHTGLHFFENVPNKVSWIIVFLNTVFSIFDTIGRQFGGHKYFSQLSNAGVKTLTFVRTFFCATFFLIAYKAQPVWLFQTDWFIITNMVLFAFTNGYCSTLCAVKAPQTVPVEERGQVGGFIGITITFGILVGSCIAFGLTPLVNRA